MRTTLVGLTALLLLAGTAWAEEKPKADGPAERLKALQTQMEKLNKDVRQKIANAKTGAERNEAIAAYRKDMNALGKRLFELGEAHPATEAGAEALAAALAMDIEADKAAGLLTKHHLASLKMVDVVQSLQPSPAARKLAQAVLEKSTLAPAQAFAALALAGMLKSDVEEANKPEEAAKAMKEAEALYDRVVKDFGTVEAAVQSAKDELFILRNLAVGKEAPEISGEDADGKKFKLSDYRGKVVVLDFWAEW